MWSLRIKLKLKMEMLIPLCILNTQNPGLRINICCLRILVYVKGYTLSSALRLSGVGSTLQFFCFLPVN